MTLKDQMKSFQFSDYFHNVDKTAFGCE